MKTQAPHLAKYLIIERDGVQSPVLFPASMQHRDMVPSGAQRVISAGFYQIIDANLLLVGGQSMSLGLCARIEDEPLIKQLLVAASL